MEITYSESTIPHYCTNGIDTQLKEHSLMSCEIGGAFSSYFLLTVTTQSTFYLEKSRMMIFGDGHPRVPDM